MAARGSILLALVLEFGLQGQQLGEGRIGIGLLVAGGTLRAREGPVAALVVALGATLVEGPVPLGAATLGPVASGAVPLRAIPLGTSVEAFEAALVAAGLLGALGGPAGRGRLALNGWRGSLLLLAIAGPLTLLVAARAATVASATLALGSTTVLRPAAWTPDFDEGFLNDGFRRSFPVLGRRRFGDSFLRRRGHGNNVF
jgi:hypothetical protein